jgi:hypothetical protein
VAEPEEEEVTTEDPKGEPEEPTGEPEPELLLGKFKTVDDLAKSYQEAERKLTTMAQEQAAPVRAPAEVPLEDQETLADKWNAAFYANPAQTTSQLIQLATQQTRAANANRSYGINLLADDPMFPKVRAELEHNLALMDDSYFADAKNAKETVERVYNMAVGERIRRTIQEQADPASRRKALDELGVEPTQASAAPATDTKVGRKEREALAEILGETGTKKNVDDVVKQFTEGLNDE